MDDYNSFYPPSISSKDGINAVITKNYSLYCVDDSFNLEIRGNTNFDYQRFELMYMACTPDYINNLCINRTKEETLNYLGNIPDIYVMQNVKRFDSRSYDKKAKIIEESVIFSVHLDLL